MRSIEAVSALALLAGVGSAQQPDRPPTVVVVQDPHAGEAERVHVGHLLRALDEAAARGALAPGHSVRRRVLDFHVAVDEDTGERRMSPLPEAVREQGLMADVVVCVGLDALLPFVQGPPLPPDRRIYSFAAHNLSHLPRRNELFRNLARVRGGVTLDVSLEEVIKGAGRVLARPDPMGVILSRRLPEHLVAPALKTARDQGLQLQVQWIDDGREVTKAARRLVDGGISTLIFVPDPYGTDSRVGRLALDEVRLLCIRNRVALMGSSREDPAGHFSVRPEPSRAAQRMVEMLLEDWHGNHADPPGLEPAPEVLVFANAVAAARDRIPLK